MIKLFKNFGRPFSKIVKVELAHCFQNVEFVRILEIGPGPSHEWIEYLKLNPTKSHITLFDASPELLGKVNSEDFNAEYIEGIAPRDLTQFKTNSFDIVICKNVIEHMSKDDGYKLLYEIDRISRFSSVIFTPNGFVWQPPSFNAPFNAHLSGWNPRELKELGWDNLTGHVGLKICFGPYAVPKFTSKFIQKLLGISYPFQQKFPNYCFAFSAVKQGKNARVLEI